jgi:hypothetical protein
MTSQIEDMQEFTMQKIFFLMIERTLAMVYDTKD